MNVQGLWVRSLKARMALSTLAIFLFSMWALFFYASSMLRQDMVHISGQQQLTTVTLLTSLIDAELDSRFQALEAAADRITPAMMEGTADLRQNLAQDRLLSHLFNAGVFVTRADGTAIADAPGIGRAGVNYRDRDHIATALQQGKPSIGQAIVGKKVQAPSFSMATPIHDPQGRVIGALAGDIDLSKRNFLDELIQCSFGITGGYLLVERGQGLIMSATDRSRIMQTAGNTGMALRYINGYEGTDVYVNGQGVEVLASVKDIPLADWYLASILPTAEAFAPIYAMQSRLLWATIVITILACGLTWWLLTRQLFPILSTIEHLAVMADENVPLAPLPVPEHTDVAELVIGVNRVLRTLELRETSLLEGEAFRGAIIDSVTAGILVLDRHGSIVAVNEPWRISTANTGNDGDYLHTCAGATDSMGQDCALQAAQGIQAVLDQRLPIFSMEYFCRSTDEPQWFKLVATPLHLTSGGAVVSHNNITTRKLAEANLSSAKAEAEAANHAKSRFLAAASHDLRQPLAALSLYTGMLGQAVKPGQEKLVSHMQNCVDSLSDLLNDLLDISKLDAGVVVPALSDFSMSDLCTSLQTVHEVHAAKKGLQLRCRYGHDIMLRTDRQIFSRLIGNLIDNALQYTARGGVLFATRRHAGKRWIEVWDTGEGIDQDQIPGIFEEFRQLGDGARNRGSGLGLAIVSRSAALLGLEIRVASRPGRGSMFAIALPEGSTLASAPPTDRTPFPTASPSFTIGLVEDNPDVLNAMVLGLQNLGHTVFAGTSGAALMEQLGPRAPDVLVSDYRLIAGETALDVIDAARDRFGSHLPAMILTGDTSPEELSHIAARGIAVYLKPVALTALQDYLQQAVQGSP